MKKSILSILIILLSFNLVSQGLDTNYSKPVFNSDSLGQLMLNEFINEYNKEELDYSAILKNRFADFSLHLDYKAKTYYGLGFETLKNPYYLVSSPPCKCRLN